MVYRLRSLLRNSNFNKITSLVFAYLLWMILSSSGLRTKKISVPLCFYGTHDRLIEQAPEDVTIVLLARRDALAKLDTQNLAIHINADTLLSGPQALTISEKHLLLPKSIHLQETIPSNINVIMK